MKAYSAGAKKRAKRGRSLLPANDREPNGRKSRRANAVELRAEQTEAEVKSVARERRIREDNIVPFRGKDGKVVSAESQADDPRRGYVLGLLWLDGRITQEEHDIGLKYAEDMGRFYGLTGVQFPSARAQNLFAIRGGGGDDSENRVEAAKRARAKAYELQRVISGTSEAKGALRFDIGTGRKVEHAVKHLALLDVPEARKWPPFMIALFRKGVSALRRHYGM
jgi:hypothetical protein